MRIAVSHPGKIGDALWALPTVRALCEKHQCQADFYTSDYCKPMKSLVEAQPYIYQVVIPAGYTITAMDCGVQPWQMPIDPRGYQQVYQLGFQGCPQKCIGEHIAESVGLPGEVGRNVRYENRPILASWPSACPNYIVLAARGQTTYSPLFIKFIEQLPLGIGVVEVGANGQALFPGAPGDKTGASFLEMASIISMSKGFVGLMSAPLVVANGFDHVPKVVPHDGVHWDMRHVLHTPAHHYLVNPTVEQMLKALGL